MVDHGYGCEFLRADTSNSFNGFLRLADKFVQSIMSMNLSLYPSSAVGFVIEVFGEPLIRFIAIPISCSPVSISSRVMMI